MLPEEGSEFILAVADVEDGTDLVGGDPVEKIEKFFTVAIVKALCRLVEDQQAGQLDQGSHNQHQPLFGKAESAEGE
jgi:hypothetical protein